MFFTALFFVCASPDDCRIFSHYPMQVFPSRQACIEAIIPMAIELEANGVSFVADCHQWGRGGQEV